ncbi:MAG: DUF5320 domain-containing protein [Candidatus Cloacimonetes bacterium]|nr:DUF5320 domain-containing protein [Candidatus Cloacimonadota bacterium]
MPNRDGTGPFGDGQVGRGLGPCGRPDRAQFSGMRRGMRRGIGAGFCGFGGFGRRARMQDTVLPEGNSAYLYSKDTLLEEKNRLEKLLTWVSDRLADIEK